MRDQTDARCDNAMDPILEQVTALATVIWRREHNGKLLAEELHSHVRTQLEGKARHLLAMVSEAEALCGRAPGTPAAAAPTPEPLSDDEWGAVMEFMQSHYATLTGNAVAKLWRGSLLVRGDARTAHVAAFQLRGEPPSERTQITAWLYRKADEHFGSGQMCGEIIADLAGQIERGAHVE